MCCAICRQLRGEVWKREEKRGEKSCTWDVKERLWTLRFVRSISRVHRADKRRVICQDGLKKEEEEEEQNESAEQAVTWTTKAKHRQRHRNMCFQERVEKKKKIWNQLRVVYSVSVTHRQTSRKKIGSMKLIDNKKHLSTHCNCSF